MAATVNFSLSKSVLEWARLSMGYTVEQVAKKIGVPNDKYESWEKGEKLPTYKQLEKLAEDVYKRPIAILLLKEPPVETPIKNDFRNLTNDEVSHLSPELRVALRKAKRYQIILEETFLSDELPRFKDFKVSNESNPSAAAALFRDFLDFSIETQKQWRPEDAFAQLRQLVESVGIYVFIMKLPVEEARAFCLTGDFPIIVINDEDSKNARIFSLIHETCHILFNQNDIFKDLQSGELKMEYQKIEDFCNQFASSFLVPDNYFDDDLRQMKMSGKDLNDSRIQTFARKYNVSSEVIARKLLTRRLISIDEFWTKKRFWDNMAKSAREAEREKRKHEDPGGINQGIKIVHEKGRPYVKSIINAYQSGIISSADLASYLETKFNNLPKIIERLNH